MNNKPTDLVEASCKNCLLSVFIGGHFLCTKYGMTVDPLKDFCKHIERRFINVNPNKTVVHTSEVVVKRV